MSNISQRVIHSISTGLQPSEPLPKDVIIGPSAGSSESSRTQYIQRCRYLYRWPNRQERNLDAIKLYQGTITPPHSQIRFYRNRARKIIAIFEHGHDIEPPLIEDSQIPHATIITTREFLCNIPPSSSPAAPSPSAQEFSFNLSNDPPNRNLGTSRARFATNNTNNRGKSATRTKRRRETNDEERGGTTSKRPKSTAFSASPVIAFVCGVAVGALNSNVISHVCENFT